MLVYHRVSKNLHVVPGFPQVAIFDHHFVS